MEQQPPATPLLAANPASTPPSAQHTPAPAKKRRRWIWIILLLVFALAFVLVLRHKPASAPAAGGGRHGGNMGPVSLNVATAYQGDMNVYLDAIGTVTPTYVANIVNQVTGQVMAVHYKEGQTVRKGAPLVDIDARQYVAALHTAQGALLRDKGLLAQAEMDLARYQDAWSRNAIAKQILDDQEKLVDQDRGLVKSDQGTVEADQVQVDFCHITSPITGRVGLRLVDPGNVLAGNGTTPLAVVAQVQPITVVFTIPEDSLPQVEKAMHGTALAVDAFDRTSTTKLAAGKLITTDNQIDTTTGTLKLRAQFANKNMALFPNQFVNTKLLAETLHNQVILPSSAIQRNGQQAFVYVINDNEAKIVNVKTGNVDGLLTAVTGIPNGAVVANSSFEKLQDKAKVRILKQKIASSDDSESNTP